jgi:carboxymethylenebutenolidase
MSWKRILVIVVLLIVVLVLAMLLGTGSDSQLQKKYNSPLSERGVATVLTSEVAYFKNVEGYLAMPDGEGPARASRAGGQYPGLILIHEWWGLNDNIKGLAEDFAKQGYVALAVDLYNGENASTSEQAAALAGAVRSDVEGAFENLNAAVAYLGGLKNVNSDSLASVGWCFGGGWAYEMAANDLRIDASVMYYGRFSPDDDLSMMRADILGHFGGEDTSIKVDDVKQFEAKLKTLEGDHTVFIYPNAGHAFANEDNKDAYNSEAAELAWKRTIEFLAKELK